MALDMLIASQCEVCSLVGAECCVYVPDVHHNVSQALWALASETCAFENLNNGGSLLSWTAALVFCLCAVAVCTAIGAFGCRALPSSLRDPHRRHL